MTDKTLTVTTGLAMFGIFGAIFIGLSHIIPRPVPCLDSHVERRHVPAHDETNLVPTMDFNGDMGFDLRTEHVAARDVDVVVCDRYAAERPE